MKEKYTKPEIVFESFAVSTNIAGDCTKIIARDQLNATDEGSCGIYYDGYVEGVDEPYVFISSLTGCTLEVPGLHDGMCYDVPVGGENIFAS